MTGYASIVHVRSMLPADAVISGMTNVLEVYKQTFEACAAVASPAACGVRILARCRTMQNNFGDRDRGNTAYTSGVPRAVNSRRRECLTMYMWPDNVRQLVLSGHQPVRCSTGLATAKLAAAAALFLARRKSSPLLLASGGSLRQGESHIRCRSQTNLPRSAAADALHRT